MQHWLSNTIQAATDQTEPRVARALKTMTLLILWMIWKERNNRIFKRSSATAEQLMARIKEEATNWALAGAKNMASIGVITFSE